MPTYLIEVPHSPEACGAGELAVSGSYSGCAAGAHTRWAVTDLADEDEAWRCIPALLRDTARVVSVQRLDKEETR
jgi:hypothetical protein